MAYHMKSIFKEMLYIPKGDITILPSPDDLKEKILLKGEFPLIFVEAMMKYFFPFILIFTAAVRGRGTIPILVSQLFFGIYT